MAELLDLDPGGRKAAQYLNWLYAEEYEDIDSMSREDLIYWLRTTLLNYGLNVHSEKAKEIWRESLSDR